MSEKNMLKGQPVRYWVYRNLVSTVQLTVVALLLGAVTLWLLIDRNGVSLWNSYFDFSRGIYNWALNLSLPWE